MKKRAVCALFLLCVLNILFLSACLGNEKEKQEDKSVGSADENPMAATLCKVNCAMIEKAAGVFLATRKRLPRDIDELQAAGMIDKKRIRCLSGGKFRIKANGKVCCSVHGGV